MKHERVAPCSTRIYRSACNKGLDHRDALHTSVTFNNQNGHKITRALLKIHKKHLINSELIVEPDTHGETIAITAAKARNAEFFRMLFEFDIHLNVNVIQDNETKYTPIMIAINNNDEETAIAILCVAHDNYVKHLSCECGRGSLVRKNKSGDTILFGAIMKGMNELTSMIIDILTNTEILKSSKYLTNHIEGYNILHAAIKHGHFDIIEYLHENLPDHIMTELIKMKDMQGQTPLDLAIVMGIQNIENRKLSQEIIAILQGNSFKKQRRFI